MLLNCFIANWMMREVIGTSQVQIQINGLNSLALQNATENPTPTAPPPKKK